MDTEGTVTLLSNKYDKEGSDEAVDGITIIIDGPIKQVLDIIIRKSGHYKDYTEVVRDALFEGLNSLTQSIK